MKTTDNQDNRPLHEAQSRYRGWSLASFAILMFVASGCESWQKISPTYHLWNSAEFRTFNEPAPNPRIALFSATNRADVLAEYDSMSEGSSVPKRRAYFVKANEIRIAQRKKPRFVKLAVASGMTPIPILAAEPSDTDRPMPKRSYVVVDRGSRAFRLHLDGDSGELHELPVYLEKSGTTARVALTPIALTGDALIAAGFAALGVLVALVQSNASFTMH